MTKSISKPLIAYPGGKSRVAEKIINEFPKEYDTIVEPFVGGGSVYWKETKATKRVINDKSKELIDFYKKFKDTPCQEVRKCSLNLNKEERKKACNDRNKSVCKYLQGNKLSFTGFCELGFSNKERKMSNVKRDCEDYKEKLKRTTITNQDWKTVAKKHEGKKTVLYMDPPYSKKSFKYREEGVTPKEVCDFAKKSKSKVIISYDDSPEVRKACKGLKMKTLEVPYQLTSASVGKHVMKKELLIKNY